MVVPSLGSVSTKKTCSFPPPRLNFFAPRQAGQEAIYLRETLTDFGYSQTKATLFYKDNPKLKQLFSTKTILHYYERESGAQEILSSHRHQTTLCAQTRPSLGSQARATAHPPKDGEIALWRSTNG